jgi:hypothetical protein
MKRRNAERKSKATLKQEEGDWKAIWYTWEMSDPYTILFRILQGRDHCHTRW